MRREPYNYYKEQEEKNTDKRALMYSQMERYWNSQYKREQPKPVSR